MTHLGIRRLVAGTATTLLLVAGLCGCGGDDDEVAPGDAATTDFCRALEDAPDADATADDYHDYAGRLQDTGTPEQIGGSAREGFELFVGYLAEVDDAGVATVKTSDEPSDVFSGADADKVESFKQGYVVACQAEPTSTPSPGSTPTSDPSGGILPGLSSDPAP